MPRRRVDRGRPRAAAYATATVVALVVLTARGPGAVCPDPFAFLAPTVVVGEKDRQRLDRGDPLVRILPGQDREIVVFGAVAVEFGGERLAAWMREIEALKKSDHVPAVARFSDPPTFDDLADHTLTDEDLDSLRSCRVGHCDLKLTSDEIDRVRTALAAAGPEWKAAAQEVVRQVLFDRIIAYRASGQAALGIYADGHTEEAPPAITRTLLERSPYLVDRMPALVDYLMRYPDASLPESESFLYWSIDRFGGRPVTSATHVVVVRSNGPDLPDTLVVGKQIFATHYQNGSLSLTMLLHGCPAPNYLAYLSRSEVDVLRGMFGWLARRVIQGRVEDEAAEILDGLRERLSRPPGDAGG